MWGFAAIYAVYQGLWIAEATVENEFLGNALMLTLIIYGPRFLLAKIIQIDLAMKGEIISLVRAHEKTKGKYWKTFGCLVLLLLIAEVPSYLLLTLNNPITDIVSELYFACIGTLFYMLIPAIALSSETTGVIKRVFKMLKGNYLRVLLLYALTTTLLSYTRLIIERFSFNSLVQNTINIIFIIALFFVFPFSQIVAVVTYKMLVKNSKTNKTKIPTNDKEVVRRRRERS